MIGLENGDILDLDPHKIDNRKLFSGKLRALVQAADKSGDVTVTVRGAGLKPATVTLHMK